MGFTQQKSKWKKKRNVWRDKNPKMIWILGGFGDGWRRLVPKKNSSSIKFLSNYVMFRWKI